MFLNKAKEQLGQEKANVHSFPHASASSTSSPHYPTAVLAIHGSVEAGGPGMRLVPKQEGGGGMSALGGHLHQSLATQNITVVPVPSTGIMTADKKENMSLPPAVVMPMPSKRGRKSKQMLARVAGMGVVLPPGSDALILAHLAAAGQHHTADPYDLSNDEDDHASRDGPKSYRYWELIQICW